MDQGFGHSSSPQICHCNLAERHKCLSNSHGGIEVRGAYQGAGADDVLLTGEAILVEPEDPQQLANAVSAAWNDHDLRRSVALKGREYAETMQGTRRYMTDLLRIIDELLEERATNLRPPA